MKLKRLLCGIGLVLSASLADAALTNSWTNSVSSFWDITNNWSLGVAPSNNQAAVLITNATTKTALIDSFTAAIPGVMTISNLFLSGPVGTVNTLALTNPGTNTPLRILNSLSISNGGSLQIQSGAVQVDGLSGGRFIVDGGAILNNAAARLVTTSVATDVGSSGSGSLTVQSGTWLATTEVNVGLFPGSQGTLTLVGGTNTLSSFLVAGLNSISTGAVWLTGGQLTVTNNETYLGYFGVGQMTVSNGTWLAQQVLVGLFGSISQGTLTIAGGTTMLSSNLGVGGVTGAVWVTGGQLTVTNSETDVGLRRVGQMTVSNGIWQARNVNVGLTNGSQGTLTVAGGTNTVSSTLHIGESANATGVVWLTGGRLLGTNSTTTVGNSGVGQMTVSNCTWQAGDVQVGANSGSQGTLTVAGGTNTLAFSLRIGQNGNATGAVWLTGGQLTVTNDDTIVGEQGVGQMTVSNGTWRTLDASVSIYDGSQGTLTVAGGTNTVSSSLTLGEFAGTGTVWVTGGLLTMTNGTAAVGAVGVGRMTVSNGTWLVGSVDVGRSGSGTLTVAGGTNMLSSLSTGVFPGSDGTVWLTAGQLTVTNSSINIGSSGVGRMTVSNGTWLARDVTVGVFSGSQGTVTLAGGTNILPGILDVSVFPGATGAVWVTGGQLTVTNATTTIGNQGVAQMTASNGTTLLRNIVVALTSASQGTLTVAGGKILVYSNLTVGTFDCAATGIVSVTGGQLRVTNDVVTAVLEVRSGTLTQTGGTLDIDRLVITNACGHFIHASGTLITGLVTLGPGLDADGDGLPNGWEQTHVLDPLSPFGKDGADGDLDGDGMSNLAELTAGTDPNDPNSALRITSITRESNNLRVTWTTVTNKTYRVLVSTGDAGGGFTNDFSNLSPFVTATSSGESTTNFLDVGGATNRPARYYYVRLVP